jgi:hypothetical protein
MAEAKGVIMSKEVKIGKFSKLQKIDLSGFRPDRSNFPLDIHQISH